MNNNVNPFYYRPVDVRCILLVCFMSFGALALPGANYYVATNGIDGTGLDWGHAASNIQYAVDLAITPNDTVWVSNGIYCVTNQIMITNNITVRGLNGWTNTLVYADSAYTNTRCFYVSRTGVVDGFMITNGHYMASNQYNGGGGAYLATGTIQNCYFIRNVCSNGALYVGGGGVFINNGTVSNCIFVANVVDHVGVASEQQGGGAIYMYQTATVIGCHMASNKTALVNYIYGRGGAIYASDHASTKLISNCTFNANATPNDGVAAAVTMGSANCTMTDCVITNHTITGTEIIRSGGSLRNCVIANNKSTYGPAIRNTYATNCIIANNESMTANQNNCGGGIIAGVIDGCIISNNICRQGPGGGGVIILTAGGILRNSLVHHNTNMSASGNGGGVLVSNVANMSGGGIYNCTITDNYSTNSGGGMAAFGANNYIANSIIAGNNAYSNTDAEIYNTEANSNNYWYCCANPTSAPLAAGQGNITNDPVFAGANNWRLAANSPCINTGTNISWMTSGYDLDWKTRIRYGTVDMGAYERINDGTVYKLW